MNLFSLTSLIIFFSSIGFGLTIYTGDRESRINRSWLMLSIAIAFWGLGLYGVTSASSATTALLWQNLLDVSAIFIPVSFLYFVLVITNLSGRLWLWAAMICATALTLFSFTPVYKLGVIPRYDFYWVNPGPGYIVFPVFFTFIVILSIYILIKSYSQNKDRIFRAQIRNVFLAGLIGFGGGLTNFFPQVFNIYPFGNYLVILYLFFTSYGVLKYRLMNRKIIAAQIFGGAVVLVFLFNLLQPVLSIIDWLIKFLLFILVSFFSALLVRGVYREVEQRERIQKLAEELETTNARQETLIHFIGHEVKGSLAKNMGAFAALAEGDFGQLQDGMKSFVERALTESRSGVESVMNILTASNLKRGTVAYAKEPFDLKALVTQAVEKAKPAAGQKGLALSFNTDGSSYEMAGDKAQMSDHVLHNLIDNAINYTPSGSVAVSLEKTRDESLGRDMLVFKVKDTGVGITEEDKKRLFTEGGHGKDSQTINAHSTGYGLFIAKQIVEAHGGTILAASEGAGKGSTFIAEFRAG